MSDMYMPKDFSDDPHEQLSRDMSSGVYLEELVKIYLDADQMKKDEAGDASLLEERNRKLRAHGHVVERDGTVHMHNDASPLSNAEASSSANETSHLLQNRAGVPNQF